MVQVAAFYESYLVPELDTAEGTAWMAWPRTLGALPNSSKPLNCPEHSLGPAGVECIVPRRSAGRLCHTTIKGCTGVAYTSDTAWNKRFPAACMLTAGPPVPSGPAGSAWDVRAWVSYTKPAIANGTKTFNVPKSCSMEMCALGSLGANLEQSNPALELPLIRRVLEAALRFSALLRPTPDSAQRARAALWADILEHLAPLPLTSVPAGEGA